MVQVRFRGAWFPGAALGALLALSACAPVDESGSPAVGVAADGGTGNFGIAFASPPSAGAINLDQSHDSGDNQSVTFEIAVNGFALAPAGSCGGRANCGHLVLFVDGNSCGSPNSVSSSSSVSAHFGKCQRMDGPHVVTVELDDDNGRTLATCNPLAVNVTCSSCAANPGNGQGAAIAIVSPAQGQTCVADKHDKTCPVVVSVFGAVIGARGACGSSTSCGHLALFVDGTACGNPNNESSSRSVLARFDRCAKVNGTHTLACELRDDREHAVARSAAVTIQVQHEDEGDGEDDD